MYGYKRKRIKKNKDTLALLKTSENRNIILGSNQSIDIRCQTDNEINYLATCAIFH